MNYPLYGRVVGCDRPLDFHTTEREADLAIAERYEVAAGRELIHDVPDPGGGRRLRIWDAPQRPIVEYDGWRFGLSRGAVEYVGIDDHDCPFDLVVERVVVPLVRLLSEQGLCALHGSAAFIDGRAVVFIGPSGSGKSTTARLLAERGSFACDDLTMIGPSVAGSEPLVFPSAAGVRAFEDVGPTGRELYRGSTKRWFLFDTPPPEPCPLGLVVLLERRDAFEVDVLKGAHSVVTLLANAFDLERPPTDWSEARLSAVTAVARSVPVVRAVYPSNDGAPAHVDALWRQIESCVSW